MPNGKRLLTCGLTLATLLAAAITATAADRPGRGDGPRDRGPDGRRDGGRRGGFGGGPRDGVGEGPRSPLERAVVELGFAEAKRDGCLAAVRTYQSDVRALNELAAAGLMLKLKGILTPEQFKKVRETAERSRPEGPFGPGRGAGRPVTSGDTADRILSFDKNKDGKVTADELPERMAGVIERGDANKDGSLDAEEVKSLAAAAPREGGDRFARGPGRPGGRGDGAGRVTPGGVERALDALALSGKPKEDADAAVKEHRESTRKLAELARAELVLTAGDFLSEDELKQLTAVLDRQAPPRERPGRREVRSSDPT